MFEEAAKLWREQDIVGYAIALYAHDDVACKAFWQYRFGRRCINLIRKLEPMGEIINKDLSFEELPLEEFPKLRKLRRELNNHLKQNPCFMQSTADEFEAWADRVEEGNRRTFVAKDGDRIIAYLDIADEGETFITWRDEMVNIKGVYCVSEYRGRHVYDDLLEFVIETMMKEGYTLLGVDCESYNPSALHFWNKHFKEYTSSVTRRTENWASK